MSALDFSGAVVFEKIKIYKVVELIVGLYLLHTILPCYGAFGVYDNVAKDKTN